MDPERYSMGVGDRFARQGRAQLQAMVQAAEQGVQVAPVWNKSHREHTIIGTSPDDVRAEAEAAVSALGWTGSYHVDADHIGLGNVDLFIAASDFFTLDVADFIGQAPPEDEVRAFADRHVDLLGELSIPGIQESLTVDKAEVERIARDFLLAVRKAGEIYRHIAAVRGAGAFVTEVSVDESLQPQTPVEMLFILAAIADEKIPAQTIAPKFNGRFNKGVDYVGDLDTFTREFREDLAVIAFAVREFGLPADLKMSVHSGSDKFSLYTPIREAIRETNAGLHLKTAGTTWLEELIGLALAGGDGLALARQVYREAHGRFDELCGPYATVIDIDTEQLPDPGTVDEWSGEDYAAALRHDQQCPAYNRHFRQMLHVGYKVAAELGTRYLDVLESCEPTVAAGVTENIFDRHLKPLFLG